MQMQSLATVRRSSSWGSSSAHAPTSGLDGTLGGAACGGASIPKKKDFALLVESFNGSVWSTIRKRLRRTCAHVLVAQEHRLREAEIAEASAYALKEGFKSLWIPAVDTGTGGRQTSGGVAIFVRSWLSLSQVGGRGDDGEREDRDPVMLVPGRLMAAMVAGPGIRGLVVYGVYGQCSVGLAQANIDVYEQLARHVASHDLPWLAAGDFNVAPQQLEESGIPKSLGASLVFNPSIPTMVSKKVVSCLDYFIVSDKFRQFVADWGVDTKARCKPHRPVWMECVPCIAAQTVQVLVTPKKLPVVHMVGPQCKPPDYAEVVSTLHEAQDMARQGDLRGASQLQDEAHALWARKAEKEVALATDVVPP